MLSAFLAALLLAGPVSTGQQQQAAALFRASNTEYELGNFEAALVDIAKAYRLDPRPGLLYNLGQCHRALHHWERAAFFYTEFIHKVPTAPNRTSVKRLIAEMQRNLKAEGGTPVYGPREPAYAQPAPRRAPAPVAAPGPVPTAAVTAPAPPPPHGHALGIGLLAAGLACGALTAVSALEIVHYNGAYAGSANQFPGQLAYGPDVSAAQSQAGVWQVVEIASAIAGAVGVGVSPFVW